MHRRAQFVGHVGEGIRTLAWWAALVSRKGRFQFDGAGVDQLLQMVPVLAQFGSISLRSVMSQMVTRPPPPKCAVTSTVRPFGRARSMR